MGLAMEKDNTQKTKGSLVSSAASFSPQAAASIHTNQLHHASEHTAVLRARFLFLIVLGCVAAVLGYVAYCIIQEAEEDMATSMFESIADRALSEALIIAQQKRWSAITMASVVSEMYPNAKDYPFVTIHGFERIANNMLNTSLNLNMGFAPIVPSSDQEEWEEFMYAHYKDNPPTSSFGRGIWGADYMLPSYDKRYHDIGNTTAVLRYGSPNDILTPIAQTNTDSDMDAESMRLFNFHSEEVGGREIDRMIQCSQERKTNTTTRSDRDCGEITGMVSFFGYENAGPSAVTYTPIYPANDPATITAMIATPILWSQLLNNAFADEVSGVDAVLEANGELFTYTVVKGIPQPVGPGDLHQKQYDNLRRACSVTDGAYYNFQSTRYTLALYPSDELFNVYATSNPATATIGAVCIIILIALLFVLFDFLVQREFLANKELLHAKRNFIRFVSHEVRTPLNAVCMGLTVIQTEMAQALGYTSVDELIQAEEEQPCLPTQEPNSRQKETQEERRPTNHTNDDAHDQKLPLFSASSPHSINAASQNQPPNQPLFAIPDHDNGQNLPSSSTSPPPSIGVASQTQSTGNQPLFAIPSAGADNKDQTQPTNQPLFAIPSAAADSKDQTQPLFSIVSATTTTESSGPTRGRQITNDDHHQKSSTNLNRDNAMEWFRLIQDILCNTHSAVDVLSDVLNYDKITCGSMTLDLAKVRIWQLVEDAMKEFRLSAQRKNISFSVEFSAVGGEEGDVYPEDEEMGGARYTTVAALPQETRDCKVIGDHVRIVQVLRNLASNAIKFTPVGGSIHIIATWHKPSLDNARKARRIHLTKGEEISLTPNGYVTLEVRDTGAGLTQSQLQCLFQEGMQFNAAELQEGKGSGFGLFIAKGIVEMHEGTLKAESEGIGKGTSFTMKLPLYACPDEDMSGNGQDAYGGGFHSGLGGDAVASLSVLIVDDAVSNRKLLSRLLKNSGHVCDQADDGDTAVQMVLDKMSKRGRYDTVLLDYEMPRMNGPTAAKELRLKGSDSFIVGITGNMLPEDVSYFLSCGANAVLPKPLKMKDLDDLWTEHDVVSRGLGMVPPTTATTCSEVSNSVPV